MFNVGKSEWAVIHPRNCRGSGSVLAQLQPKAKATANRPASFSSLADVERNARTEVAKRFGGPYRYSAV